MIYTESKYKATIYVVLGTLDYETYVAPPLEETNHIFLKEKAPWFTLPEDGVKRFEEFT